MDTRFSDMAMSMIQRFQGPQALSHALPELRCDTCGRVLTGDDPDGGAGPYCKDCEEVIDPDPPGQRGD